MKVFTIIKDQSERIKDKNFQPFGDKPLWQNLITELKGLDITINTDSIRLIQQVEQDSLSFLNIVKRSQKHIDWENDPKIKTSPVEDMLFEFSRLQDPNEIVVLTHVTSPFLQRSTVLDAVKFLIDNPNYKSVHSVDKIQDFSWLSTNKLVEPINFDHTCVQRTQDLDPILVSKGAFFIARAKDILKASKRLPEPVFYYEISQFEAIEIDTWDQLTFAQKLRRIL